jgi:hypothetical protein
LLGQRVGDPVVDRLQFPNRCFFDASFGIGYSANIIVDWVTFIDRFEIAALALVDGVIAQLGDLCAVLRDLEFLCRDNAFLAFVLGDCGSGDSRVIDRLFLLVF